VGVVGITGRALTMPVVVLDASVWVSGLLPGDVNHAPAIRWLTRHINNGGYFVAPVLFVIETGAAISRVTQNPTAAHEAVRQIYLNPLISLEPITQDVVDEAADLAVDLTLKTGDALYAAVAKRLQLPLVTLDTDLLTRTAGVITTVRP
jgi:predicted nucleic acid-binding protein